MKTNEMRNIKRRLLSLVLAVAMVLTNVPVSVFAEETNEPKVDTSASIQMDVTEPETMEAASFSDYANGLLVTVNAPEGAFKTGTKMRVTTVASNAVIDTVSDVIDGEVEKVRAVDISFYNDESDNVEPLVPIQVTISALTMDGSKDLSVVHVADSGSAEVVAEMDGNRTTFESDAFSVYVVVETGTTDEDARLAVNFVGVDGDTVTQYVTKKQLSDIEDYIYDPGVKNMPEGTIFKGWTKDDEYTYESSALTIENIRNEVTDLAGESGFQEGDEVTYYAMLFAPRYVTYLDEKDLVIKVDESLQRLDDTTAKSYTINQTYVPYPVENPDENPGVVSEFVGWKQISPEVSGDAPIYQNSESISLDADYVLEADVEQGHWLSFNGNGAGASYTGPVFIIKGETAQSKKPADPTRKGFEFDGWYEDASGTTAFNWNGTIEANKTLYAKWTEHTRAYFYYNIWKQNVEGTGYDLAESIQINNAAVNTEITYATSGNGNATTVRIYNNNNNRTRYARVNGSNYQYEGFHLESYDTGKKVVSNNSTVVNLYYNRNTYILTFQQYSGGYFGSWNTFKTIEGLYGADISSQFPIASGNGYTARAGDRWDPQNSSNFDDVIIYLKAIPAEDINFHLDRQENFPTRYFTLYEEALPGATNTVTYKGKQYTQMGNVVSGNLNWVEYDLDFVDIEGYTKAGANPDYPVNSTQHITNTNNFSFFYNRKSYTLHYQDGTYIDKNDHPILGVDKQSEFGTESVAYGFPLAGYDSKVTPTRDEYVFLGWYADEGCSIPYDFANGTMPMNDVTVYAKWKIKRYAVTLEVCDDDGTDKATWDPEGQALSMNLDYGETVQLGRVLRDYHSFIAWYTDPEYKNLYNLDLPMNDANVPSGSLTLYARWRSKLDNEEGIKLFYDATEDGSGAPTDRHGYTDKSDAIAGAASKYKDDTQHFQHWVILGSDGEETEKTVLPGKTFQIDVNDAVVKEEDGTKSYTITLKAVYKPADEPKYTFINFYNGFGALVKNVGGDEENPTLEMNKDVDVPTDPTAENYRPGYEFLGWTKKTDDGASITTSSTDTLLIKWDGSSYDYSKVAADEILVEGKHEALYGVWDAKEVDYKVEFYYQDDTGEGYTKDDSLTATRQAKTDTTVNVTDADKAQTKAGKYEFDSGNANNKLTDTVAGNGSTVLKLYFKLSKADVTVAHYLKGETTAFKTSTTTETIGSTYSATPETEYQGKTLTVDHWDPSGAEQGITVAASGNVIKIYYTIPLKITVDDKTDTYTSEVLYGYGKEDTDKITIDALEEDKDKITFEYTPSSGTNVGTYTNGAFGTVTAPGYYTNDLTPGKLTIEKAAEYEIVVTGKSDVKVYNTEEQSVNGYTVSEYDDTITFNGIAQDDEKATAKGTDAGTYTMTMSEADFSATSDNYTNIKITVNPGTLKINKASNDKLGLTAEDYSGAYDGAAHGITATVTVTEGTQLYYSTVDPESEGFDESNWSNANPEWTDFTDVAKTVYVKAENKNYETAYASATVTITKKEITANATATEMYDGSPKTLTITADDASGVVSGETLTLTGATISETDAGEYTTVADYSWSVKKADDSDSTNNYTISVTGTLTINKAKLTLTPYDMNLDYIAVEQGVGDTVYDDPAAIASVIKIGGDGLQGSDYIATLVLDGQGLEAGTYDINIGWLCQIKNSDGDSVNNNYEITKKPGTLTINKVPLTITLLPQSYTYDGSAHGESNATYTDETVIKDKVTVDELKGNDKLVKVILNGQQTDAGVYNEEIAASGVVIENSPYPYPLDRTKNYIITFVKGDLTIKKSDKMTVTAVSYEGVYDGKEHKGGATPSVTNGTTLQYSKDGGKTWSSTVPSIKDAGEIEYTVKATNPNYEDATAIATLTVTPKPVTVKADNKSKVYSEKDPKLTAKVTGLVGSDTVNYSVDRESGEEVGSYTIIPSGDAKQGNYIVEYENGTLSITKAPASALGLEATGYTGKYDGDIHNGYATAKVTDGTTIEYSIDGGKTWSETEPTITNVDKIDFQARAVNPNYETATDDATLEITKRNITLTSTSDEKEYDGTPLTRNDSELDINVEGDGFAGEEGATYDITGSQTLVGSSDNTFTYTLNKGTLAGNYNITTKFGTLTVTGDKIDGDKTTPEVESNYKLGDAIPFTITVENVSDEAVETTVTDPNATILAGTGYTVSGGTATMTVPAGGKVVVNAEHIVTQADILNGTVENTATIGWDDQEKPVKATTDFIDDPDTTLGVEKTVTSTSEDPSGYAKGETITYDIIVTNKGNLDYTNLVVKDPLTGLNQTIAKLAVGASETISTSYVVTNADVLTGSVYNQVTVTGDEIPGGNKPEGEDDEEVPTIDVKGDIEVTKIITNEPENGIGYRVGEEITYQITVKNIGTVDYPNVVVTDDLTEESWLIDTLAVGQEETFTTSYTVTEDDMDSMTLTNTATAIGDPIEDPKNPGTEIIPQGEDPEDAPIDNSIDGAKYDLIIHYIAEGEEFDTFTRTYTEGDEYNVTSPRRRGFTPDQKVVSGTITGPTEITVEYTRNSYTVTVTYRDPYGNIVAQTTTRKLPYGDTYYIPSPNVPGYTTTTPFVTGKVPARDVQITVFYTPVTPEQPVDNTIVISDYDAPLGLGNVSLNAGDCFE